MHAHSKVAIGGWVNRCTFQLRSRQQGCIKVPNFLLRSYTQTVQETKRGQALEPLVVRSTNDWTTSLSQTRTPWHPTSNLGVSRVRAFVLHLLRILTPRSLGTYLLAGAWPRITRVGMKGDERKGASSASPEQNYNGRGDLHMMGWHAKK
jgi:hypothetical protein